MFGLSLGIMFFVLFTMLAIIGDKVGLRRLDFNLSLLITVASFIVGLLGQKGLNDTIKNTLKNKR